MNLTKNIIYIFWGLFISFTIHSQTEIVRICLIDECNNPVEGAYVSVLDQRRNFWYSDTIGVVSIPLARLAPNDTLSFLHVSYKPAYIDAKSLISSLNYRKIIQLESDIKVLKEIIVKPLDPVKLVNEAIHLIPSLYAPIFDFALFLHADIDIFDANDSTSVIYYKGALHISQPNPKKLPIVRKFPEIERVSKDAKNQLYPIRISNFAKMISLKKFGVISNSKNYIFDKYQFVRYKGSEAVQIFFHTGKGNFVQTGYMIIKEETKAIVAFQCVTKPMKNVMKSMVKGIMRQTDLDSYRVEVSYELNLNNLYEFESGIYYEQYTNRWKNMTKSVILNSYLKKILFLMLDLKQKFLLINCL